MIYLIKNPFNGKCDYICDDEAIVLANKDNSFISSIELGGEAEANLKLQENASAYLAQEAYRFNVGKEIIEGNNTVWCAADLENDAEIGAYHVFNNNTGGYEIFGTLTEAKQRLQQLKDELLSANKLDSFKIVDEVPQPILVNYGKLLSKIPVENM